jgi:orotidine-5'-phosphate decarboxylase
MMRYGDQEQPPPEGPSPRTSPDAPSMAQDAIVTGAHPVLPWGVPSPSTPRRPVSWQGPALASALADEPRGGSAGLAGQDEARVPHQRQASWRRPESLRALPSLARFLTRASHAPGGATIERVANGDPGGDADAGPVAGAGEGTAAAPGAGAAQDAGEAARPATGRAEAPETSAAELRELTELSDLLAELAGLIHDLSGLIVGLMTAAAGGGDPQVRTFTMPSEVAELVQAHHDLKAEQKTLNARLAASRGHRDRTALRGSLATLTERATRAVAIAAAAVSPQEIQPSGTPVQGTTPGESGSRLREPSREEIGVQRLAPVAVALDAPDIDVAAHWATLVTPYVSTVKIGLELYLRYGPAVVATVRGGSGVHVFLDLKLHDIPNTVAGAARAVAKLRPEILTVHAAGGADMIKAAVEAAPDTIVAGVTLLTSIGDKDLAELGMEGSVSDAVRRMATLAVTAGARGLVCSPQEVAAVRAEVGPGILLITPGIRLAGATSDDQARIATPVEAMKAGADLLVIGRPITKAADPGAAAAAIAASLRRGV